MRMPVFVDLPNGCQPDEMRRHNFKYVSIVRPEPGGQARPDEQDSIVN